MENQPKQTAPGDEKEVDLGVLFDVFSKVAHKILSGLRSIFGWIFEVILLFLLFLKRRILLVLVGLLLSLVPGLYSYLTKGDQYYSSMTVRANFGSTHDLYNKIEYFNSLIKVGDNRKLGEIFHLPESEAAKLRSFDIAPVDDELQVAELYRRTFYDLDRTFEPLSFESGALVQRDSSWRTLIKFNEFKNRLQNTDFPVQTITVRSWSPEIFSHLDTGLIETVSATRSLENSRLAEDSMAHEQTNLILASLSNADTLLKSYGKKIASTDRATDVTTLAITAQPAHSAVAELFDKSKDLRRSLTSARQLGEENRDILQVYSDFNATGMPVSPFKDSFVQYSLWCLLGMIALLLLVEGYLKLGELEKRRNNANGK